MRRALPHVLAWFVGAITLAFTVGLCLHERESERARLHAIFDLNARQTVDRVEQRMADYEQMLANVADLPPEQRKSLMVNALNELVYVIQLSVRTKHGAQEEAVVSGIIKDGLKKLGV